MTKQVHELAKSKIDWSKPAEADDAYNWGEAFEVSFRDYCLFDANDVVITLASSPGENDGPDWLWCGMLRDGRFAFMSAGCDSTGWGCQDGGTQFVYDSLPNLIFRKMGAEERRRLDVWPLLRGYAPEGLVDALIAEGYDHPLNGYVELAIAFGIIRREQ